MSSFGRRTAPTTVWLNVYDLAPANEIMFPLGLGLYHTGVEIYGTEYTFADTAGVFSHPPKAVPNAKLRLQLDLGPCDPTLVASVVSTLSSSDKFGPNDYNILQNNCNHFAQALVWNLLQKPIPVWINRLANLGACCGCLIPKQLLGNGAPVNDNNNNNSETTPFLVKAPTNRINSIGTTTGINNNSNDSSATTNGIFHGPGSKLGGSSSSSINNGAGGSDGNLTDRREKARMAALARLERQQQQQQPPQKLND